jgi:hypothetical protein
VCAILLPWSPAIRTELVSFLLENSLAISLFGFCFLTIGLSLTINLFLNAKRKTYYFKLDENTYIVNESIIRHYLQDYFLQRFPSHPIPSRFVIKKNKIKIAADLPFIAKEDQSLLTSTIKQDLHQIFNKVLGYPHECLLTLTFPKK